MVFSNIWFLFYEKNLYPSILRPLKYVLAFKILYFEYEVQIWTKGTSKHLTRWYKSIFEPISFPVCNLVFLATRAAFLTISALKLKNKEKCELVTPNSPINLKKWFRYCWLSGLCLAFMTFVGLFHFSFNPWYPRRPVVCFKVKYGQYNLKTLTIPKFWI